MVEMLVVEMLVVEMQVAEVTEITVAGAVSQDARLQSSCEKIREAASCCTQLVEVHRCRGLYKGHCATQSNDVTAGLCANPDAHAACSKDRVGQFRMFAAPHVAFI